MTLDPNLATWYTPPPRATIADYDRGIDRATAALWNTLELAMENRPSPATVRGWASAVVDAFADVSEPAVGNYGPGQPRPRDTDNACGDEWQPAHAASSRPDDCSTCSEQAPATGSHPTSGSSVQPVGTGQAATSEQPVVASQPVADPTPPSQLPSAP
jgi:hypothetical protein